MSHHPGAARRAAVRARARPLLGLATVLAVFLLVEGWIVVSGDFLPYVYDSGETFSTFWHAYNLYHFDLRASAGLTDETFSPHPEAHPFVHTHQGNLPRLYALALYALGARTPQSQVVLTTFTLGSLAVTLAYWYFQRLGGTLAATVIGLFLVTDYLLFAQWQVVTYRVWHGLLLFAALLAARSVGGRLGRRWLLVLFVATAGLFYYELVFAGFTSLFAALTVGWQQRRRPAVVLRAWAVQAAGALVSVGVLTTQLVLHLGWRVAAEDFYLTFFARNAAATDQRLVDRLDAFYRSYNIAFWYNLLDVRGLRSPERLVGLLFELHFELQTPLLTLLTLLVLAGWLAGFILVGPGRPRLRLRPDGVRLTGGLQIELPGLTLRAVGGARWRPGPRVAGLLRPTAGLLALALLGVGGAALAWGVAASGAPLGQPAAGSGVGRAALGGAGLGLGAAALLAARGLLGRAARLAPAGLALAAAALLVTQHGRLYRPEYAPLWRDALTAWAPGLLVGAASVGAAGLAMALALRGPGALLGTETTRQAAGLLVHLGLGLVAYTVVYFLTPGYVYSGYLSHGAPFAIFVLAPATPLALLLAIRAGWRGLRPHAGCPNSGRRPTWPALGGAGGHRHAQTLSQAAGLLLLLTAAFMAAHWLQVQRTYATLLPPDYFSELFRRLAAPPLRGSSAVGNAYGAPIAALTGEWAYIDLTIGRNEVRLTDSGYELAQETLTYLWMADRKTNPAYRRPDLYICMRQQGPATALARVTGNYDDLERCGDVPLVAQAAAGTSPVLQHRLLARAGGPLDQWAIVELDWSFPPPPLPRDRTPAGPGHASGRVPDEEAPRHVPAEGSR